MPLQLRVISTGQLLEVPDEGQTIGRKGGQADVQLNDNGLSGRHARIFADGSEWLIQDMGSTNGTMIGGVVVSGTSELQLDDIITMGATKLEVVKMWDPQLQRTMMVAAPLFDTVPTGTPAVARRTGNSSSALAAPQERDEEVEPSQAPTMIGQLAAMDPALIGVPQQEPEAEEAPEAAEAPAQQAGLKYFLVAVPKAIAFYLAAIPLMIVNPIGTIRRGVEEQRHEAKHRMELIAYALPVNLFSAAVGFLSTLIVQLVTGTVSIGGLLVGLLIIPAIVAVVVSVITGFVWHPVTGWIIGKLGGESDERSRTNYFLMFMTATALVVLPGGVGTLLGLAPFRLVAMVQPALSALGSVVLIFVTYSWMRTFNVAKWFRTVLLVLGGLAIVGGAFGMLGRLTAAAPAANVDAQIAEAQKQAEDAQQAVADATAEAKEKGAGVKAAEGDEDAPTTAKPAAKEAAVAENPPAAEGSVSYPVFVQLRDTVEKAIADDPALLTNNPKLRALYRQYTTATFEVDSKFKALDAKNPADAKLNVRLRDAELFEKSEKFVVALHDKLNAAEPKAEAKPAAAAKEEQPKAEAKPAAAAKEEQPKAEAKPVAAKEEQPKAEAKPVAAKEEKPKAEARPAVAAKEEPPKTEAKPTAAKEEKPKPAGKGKLACSSKPPDAEIWVDGKNSGKKTPLPPSSALELPAGKHTVILKLKGKASAPREITIEADRQVTLKGVEIPGA